MVLLELAQLALGAALAIATIVYAWHAREQAAVMSRPFLKASIGYLGPINAFLVIRNTGRAAAHNVKVEWSLGDDVRRWAVPLIPPGGEHRFPLVIEEDRIKVAIEELESHIEKSGDSVLRFSATCRDIRGKRRSFQEHLDLLEAFKGPAEARELYDEDPSVEVKREIKKIREELHHLRNVGDRAKRYLSRRKRAEEINLLRDLLKGNGPVGVKELEAASTIDEHTLRGFVLPSLDACGLLEFDADRDEVSWSDE